MNHGSEMSDPSGVRLTDGSVGRAASELLASNSDRRKRGRPASVASGGNAPDSGYGYHAAPPRSVEPDRKRPHVGAPVNVALAKKAAAELIRESPTYKRLNDTEERIDLAIMRKQQDIKDALKSRSYTRSRTFRLYVFNTFRSQPGGRGKEVDGEDSGGEDGETAPGKGRAGDAGENSETGDSIAGGKEEGAGQADGQGVSALDVPSWSLRIQGQFLPETSVSQTLATDCAVAAGGAGGVVEQNGLAQLGTDADVRPVAAANLRIGGQYGSGADGTAYAPPPVVPPTPILLKCTDVFKKVIIELDKEVVLQNNLIEWNRADGEPASDGFELSRAGDTECKVRIFMYVDHKPDRFKLSFVLSRLIGVKSDTRSGVFMAVWEYIKKMRLQCSEDRTSVRVDQGLWTLMPATHADQPTIKLQQLFEVIKMHMCPPDPIQLEHTVKLSGNVVDNQACYDIQIEVPDDTLHESAKLSGTFGLTYPSSAEFVALNDKHLEALEQVARHKRRREFLESFCANPIEFINHLILSQTRDLKVIAGSSGRNPEEERRSSYYQQQWVHEAVPRYLLRKAIADAARKAAEDTGTR
jgi:SWIB/MDM2 domain